MVTCMHTHTTRTHLDPSSPQMVAVFGGVDLKQCQKTSGRNSPTKEEGSSSWLRFRGRQSPSHTRRIKCLNGQHESPQHLKSHTALTPFYPKISGAFFPLVFSRRLHISVAY